MGNDVSRAYMYAFCDEDIYVERGEGDRALGNEHFCGKPVDVMYGTPARRIAYFTKINRDIMVFLHGDDFVSSGSPENRRWFDALSSKYCIKITMMGEDNKHEKQVRVQDGGQGRGLPLRRTLATSKS